MSASARPHATPAPTWMRARAWAVHALTASGVIWALLATRAIFADDLRAAFLWMCLAVAVDAADGPLARAWQVKKLAPGLDGALLDNIVDYLNYTFVPLLLIAHKGWLPEPAWLWVSVPAMASLVAFTHTEAKDSDDGFFRGFPSYWNVVAFYVAVEVHTWGPWAVAGLLLALSVLSVAPVRFAYPNRIQRLRWFFLGGSLAWSMSMVGLAATWPDVPAWAARASLVYPALYGVVSVWVDREARTR